MGDETRVDEPLWPNAVQRFIDSQEGRCFAMLPFDHLTCDLEDGHGGDHKWSTPDYAYFWRENADRSLTIRYEPVCEEQGK